jgi:hypothetical protein
MKDKNINDNDNIFDKIDINHNHKYIDNNR